MKVTKRLTPILQVSFAVLGLSGCIAILTTPITIVPLLLLSLSIVFSAPPVGQRLSIWWEALTTILLIQLSLFSLLLIGYAIDSLQKLNKRFSFHLTPYNTVRAVKKRPYAWKTIKDGLQQQSITWLIALLMPGYVIGLKYLWHQDQQASAALLILPPLLGCAILLLYALFNKPKRKITPPKPTTPRRGKYPTKTTRRPSSIPSRKKHPDIRAKLMGTDTKTPPTKDPNNNQ